jgi:hypothetical protein
VHGPERSETDYLGAAFVFIHKHDVVLATEHEAGEGYDIDKPRWMPQGGEVFEVDSGAGSK